MSVVGTAFVPAAEPTAEPGAALSVEGGLIPPDQLARVLRGQASAQAAADYALPKGLTLASEIERAFRIARAHHADLPADPVRAARALLSAFGFDDLVPDAGPCDLRTADGRAPVVVAPRPTDAVSNPIERARHEGGPASRYRSPALLLQDTLNADERALWGLVTDGRRVRLMRDSLRLGRPAYLEADLAAILKTDDLSAFTGLWLLLHRSRFGRGEGASSDCPLERWAREAAERGTAVRDRLREGVEAALKALAAGFLAEPAFRARVQGGEVPVERLHAECLRLVYRIIFLLTAEDRGLLHPPDADREAVAAYAEGYAALRLARRARRRATWDRHRDGYEGLAVVFRALQRGEAALGLPALGGLFRREMTPTIDPLPLPNRRFYEAVFNLAWIRQDGALHRVAWRDMQTEELGSVYESLLELVPRLADGGTALAYASGAEGKGHERKTTGSYYTPDALVQALLDSALDPVIRDRRRGIGTPNGETGAEGVLTMTVCDPACGSGHFLLSAARRIAEAVARERAEEGGEPYGPDAHRRALREVVARCIFGVDRNDFAVELARVALWIETVEPGRPLGFLDANIRVGDSLLGLASLDALREGVPDAAFKPLTSDDKAVARTLAKRNRAEREGQGALDLLGGGWSLPPEVARFDEAIRRAPQDTLEQVEAVRARFEGRIDDPARRRLRLAADAYVAAFLLPKREPETPGRREPEVPTSRFVWETLAGRRPDPLLEPNVTAASREAHAFHWPLAFPGVAERGGFDVMLGNPPWERVKLQEKEFFAARAPEIAEASNAAARGRAIRALLEAGPGTPGQGAARGVPGSQAYGRGGDRLRPRARRRGRALRAHGARRREHLRALRRSFSRVASTSTGARA